MQAIKQLNRLKKLDTLIQQGKTGAPEEFADRLGLSRSQLYNILEELKDLGAPIEYNRSARSFLLSGGLPDCDGRLCGIHYTSRH